MKTKKNILFFLLSVFVIHPFFISSARVSRITGSKGRQKANIAESKKIEDIKLNSPESIESAFERTKQQDLTFYKYLKRIRVKNFNKFVTELEKWVNDYNQDRINSERVIFRRDYKSTLAKLSALSMEYKNIEDAEQKKEKEDQIKEKINHLFEIIVAKEDLAIRIKKKEVARMETELIKKKTDKADFIKKMKKKYIKKDS